MIRHDPGVPAKISHVETLPARPATRADLEALPESVTGEIIDGVLYSFPRPRARHAYIESEIVTSVRGPYDKGRGGPGGWWIIAEPGIELPRAPEVAPDVAGWRRERMPELPPEGATFTMVPDWVCEVLSPSTRRFDLLVKRPFYAQVGVRWLWYVDLEARTLQVSRIHEGRWLEVAIHGGDATVTVEPFDVVELELGGWWSPR